MCTSIQTSPVSGAGCHTSQERKQHWQQDTVPYPASPACLGQVSQSLSLRAGRPTSSSAFSSRKSHSAQNHALLLLTCPLFAKFFLDPHSPKLASDSTIAGPHCLPPFQPALCLWCKITVVIGDWLIGWSHHFPSPPPVNFRRVGASFLLFPSHAPNWGQCLAYMLDAQEH